MIRRSSLVARCSSMVCGLLAACGSGASHGSTALGSFGHADAGTGGDGKQVGQVGEGDGGTLGGGSNPVDGGVTGTTGNPGPAAGGSLPVPGNPDGKCSQPLPAEAALKDVSSPSAVVGSGTPASCTEAALEGAVAKGGVITFNCGSAPVTITLSKTLELRTDVDTVLDGENRITLDGAGEVRLLSWNSPGWQTNQHTLTLQRMRLAHGKTTPTEAIPAHPDQPACSQGFNDGEGGALLMRDGSLRAIEVTFEGNQAAQLGPDTGGGALYLLGCKPSYVVRCTFKDNKASNGGAMGSLFTTDFIYDSLFEGNGATGNGANNNDASMCSYMNNGQNEVGSGGNGGAIYNDGVAMDVTVCGTEIKNNTAGAFGAAIFFTSNDQSMKGTLSIRDSTLVNNLPKNQFWEWKPGISTNANTPDPIDSSIQR